MHAEGRRDLDARQPVIERSPDPALLILVKMMHLVIDQAGGAIDHLANLPGGIDQHHSVALGADRPKRLGMIQQDAALQITVQQHRIVAGNERLQPCAIVTQQRTFPATDQHLPPAALRKGQHQVDPFRTKPLAARE